MKDATVFLVQKFGMQFRLCDDRLVLRLLLVGAGLGGELADFAVSLRTLYVEWRRGSVHKLRLAAQAALNLLGYLLSGLPLHLLVLPSKKRGGRRVLAHFERFLHAAQVD